MIEYGTATFEETIDWSGSSGEVTLVDIPGESYHIAGDLEPKWEGFVQAGEPIQTGLKVIASGNMDWQPTFSGSISFSDSNLDYPDLTLNQAGDISLVATLTIDGASRWRTGSSPVPLIANQELNQELMFGPVPLNLRFRSNVVIKSTSATQVDQSTEISLGFSGSVEEVITIDGADVESPDNGQTEAQITSGGFTGTVHGEDGLSGLSLFSIERQLSVEFLNRSKDTRLLFDTALLSGRSEYKMEELTAQTGVMEVDVSGQKKEVLVSSLYSLSGSLWPLESISTEEGVSLTSKDLEYVSTVAVADDIALIVAAIALYATATIYYAIPVEERDAWFDRLRESTTEGIAGVKQFMEDFDERVKELGQPGVVDEDIVEHLERCYAASSEECESREPAPTPTPVPSPILFCTPAPTPQPSPSPCEPPEYEDYCPDYWAKDGADISTLDPPNCHLPFLPPQNKECYSHEENRRLRRRCYEQCSDGYQSHHVVQDKAGKGIGNYSGEHAPTVLLCGGSHAYDSQHDCANRYQERWTPRQWTLDQEIDLGEGALWEALSCTQLGDPTNGNLTERVIEFQVNTCVLNYFARDLGLGPDQLMNEVK